MCRLVNRLPNQRVHIPDPCFYRFYNLGSILLHRKWYFKACDVLSLRVTSPAGRSQWVQQNDSMALAKELPSVTRVGLVALGLHSSGKDPSPAILKNLMLVWSLHSHK